MNGCLTQKEGAILRQTRLEIECHPFLSQRCQVHALLPPTQPWMDRDCLPHLSRTLEPHLHVESAIIEGGNRVPARHRSCQQENRLTV